MYFLSNKTNLRSESFLDTLFITTCHLKLISKYEGLHQVSEVCPPECSFPASAENLPWVYITVDCSNFLSLIAYFQFVECVISPKS